MNQNYEDYYEMIIKDYDDDNYYDTDVNGRLFGSYVNKCIICKYFVPRLLLTPMTANTENVHQPTCF